MGRQRKFWMLTVLIFVGTLASCSGMFVASDYYGRYASWRTMDKDKLLNRIDDYRRRYDIPPSFVCLYAVKCVDGRAKLGPIEDMNAWDIDRTKKLIWDRRFKDACPGTTANIGLHFVATTDEELYHFNEVAIWSFYHNRYLQRSGCFQSGAFSEEPWVRCTPEIALTGY